MVHNNRNEDKVETDLFQEVGAVIHGEKIHSEKERLKPVCVMALQKVTSTCEPCKCTKIAGLNLGV